MVPLSSILPATLDNFFLDGLLDLVYLFIILIEFLFAHIIMPLVGLVHLLVAVDGAILDVEYSLGVIFLAGHVALHVAELVRQADW